MFGRFRFGKIKPHGNTALTWKEVYQVAEGIAGNDDKESYLAHPFALPQSTNAAASLKLIHSSGR